MAEAEVVAEVLENGTPAEGVDNTADGADAPAAESAPATEGAAKPETTDKPQEKAGEGKSRYQRRLDRAYRQMYEQKARADFLETQMQRFAPEQPKQPDGEPRIEDFTDIKQYADAVKKYGRDSALKEHVSAVQVQTAKQFESNVVANWQAKTVAADDKYADFDEIVGDLKPTSPWAIAVMQAENAADVAYYLGKNLDEARRIVNSDPVTQIREVGKIEAKLAAAPKVKEVSKAPAPMAPITGKAGTPPLELRDGMDYAQFLKVRNKQLGRK